MLTYQNIIRSYSKTVSTGHSDTDLTPRQRRILHVLLNLASNEYQATVIYPPTDQTRDDVVREWGVKTRDFIFIAQAFGSAASDDFDKAFSRAIECLRNM